MLLAFTSACASSRSAVSTATVSVVMPSSIPCKSAILLFSIA